MASFASFQNLFEIRTKLRFQKPQKTIGEFAGLQCRWCEQESDWGEARDGVGNTFNTMLGQVKVVPGSIHNAGSMPHFDTAKGGWGHLKNKDGGEALGKKLEADCAIIIESPPIAFALKAMAENLKNTAQQYIDFDAVRMT
jgi:hypothetical protein